MKQHFNSYREGLDLEFLQEYCINHGRLVLMARGETLAEVGEQALYIAYIEKGCFKYIVHNDIEGKDYITGFSFEGELTGDYPNCLYGYNSEITLEADTPCTVYVIEGKELLRMYEEDVEKMRKGMQLAENLFLQTYTRYLDHYRLDARARYEKLLARCPKIVNQLSLKDIASFLNVHPNTISRIRKEITFGEKN